MKTITEFLSTKVSQTKIKATDETIKQIVKDELDRLGHNADLNHIDVSKVTDMSSLFSCDSINLKLKYEDLNPDISKWDVSNVESISYMFQKCINFNCDISKWDVSKVKRIRCMFCECENFNQDLSGWDVSNVKDMDMMFYLCKKFNQDLSRWDVSKVIQMQYMFSQCESFNKDISKWNVQNVKFYDHIFDDCPIEVEFMPKFN